MKRRRRLFGVLAVTALWLTAAILANHARRISSPAYVDLGAGDEAFAAGFSGGWEAHARWGEVTYRSTGEYSRLSLPIAVSGNHSVLRLRFARLTEGRAAVTVRAGDQSVTWTQGSTQWRIREIPLASDEEPLTIHVYSSCGRDCRPGIDLDWIEVRGGFDARPRRSDIAGMVLLLLLPALAAAVIRRRAPILYGCPVLFLLGTLVVSADPVNGIVALGLAGPRALIATSALLVPWLLLSKLRGREPRAASFLWIPAALVLLAVIASSYPRFYYPDVDTHARYLKAIRADPRLAIDPTPYQQQTLAWTRFIDGRRIGFPYSSVFHVMSWPLALVLGDVGAIKTLAAIAVGASMILVFFLTRRLGGGNAEARLAQVVFFLLPVIPSRLSLALYPSLLGQALEIALLVFLIARLDRIDTARGLMTATVVFALCQAAYTGSLLNVLVFVAALLPLIVAAGERKRALLLGAAYVGATVIVVAVQYHAFLPTLFHDVIPNVLDPNASADPNIVRKGSAFVAAAVRLSIFYGMIVPLLALIGLTELRRSSRIARKVVIAALVSGGLLAWLRFAVPAVFQDAKDVELLAAPIAVLVALGTTRLWRGGIPSRLAGAIGIAAFLYWSVSRAIELYLARLQIPPSA